MSEGGGFCPSQLLAQGATHRYGRTCYCDHFQIAPWVVVIEGIDFIAWVTRQIQYYGEILDNIIKWCYSHLGLLNGPITVITWSELCLYSCRSNCRITVIPWRRLRWYLWLIEIGIMQKQGNALQVPMIHITYNTIITFLSKILARNSYTFTIILIQWTRNWLSRPAAILY